MKLSKFAPPKKEKIQIPDVKLLLCVPGLQLILLMKPHVSLHSKEDSSEYSLGISSSLSMIDQKLNVINLEAGMNTIVSVTPQFVETSGAFNDLNPIARKCRLPHETFELKSVK